MGGPVLEPAIGQCLRTVRRALPRRWLEGGLRGIVKGHMKDAYLIALGLVGNREDALELSQEAFFRAYKHYDQLNSQGKFFPWFYQILRNLCFSHLRKRRVRRAHESRMEDGGAGARGGRLGTEDGALRHPSSASVNRLIWGIVSTRGWLRSGTNPRTASGGRSASSRRSTGKCHPAAFPEHVLRRDGQAALLQSGDGDQPPVLRPPTAQRNTGP